MKNKIEFKKTKHKALEIAKGRIEYFNNFYKFKVNPVRKSGTLNPVLSSGVNKITIKNQKTRWGSCSKKGNLNFNYRIAKLPQNLLDYIIVHEFCHLKEFNHSKKFWDLVSKAIPNYKKIRKIFKKVPIV